MANGDIYGLQEDALGHYQETNLNLEFDSSGGGDYVAYTFQHSLTESAEVVNLVNDEASPGNSKLYGTDADGVKGWYDQPAGSGTVYDFKHSLVEDSAGDVNLVGDLTAPGNSKYYGTNVSGTKGWFDLPAGAGGIDGSGANTRVAYWTDADTLGSDSDFTYVDGTIILTGTYGATEICGGFLEMNEIGGSETNRLLMFPGIGGAPNVGYAYMFDTTYDMGTDKLFLIREAGAETFYVDQLAMHHHNDCNANFFVQKYTGVSDDPIISHDAEASTANTAYTKLKTITLGPHVLSNRVLKIQFDLKMNTNGNPPDAYGQIRRNGDVLNEHGVPYATEQTNGTSTYVTFSEFISEWCAGDTIELWAKAISTFTAYVRNFRVCGSHESGIVNEVTGSNS